jgi:hypothetical protein
MLPQQDMSIGMNDYNDKNHYFTSMEVETTETTTTTTQPPVVVVMVWQ